LRNLRKPEVGRGEDSRVRGGCEGRYSSKRSEKARGYAGMARYVGMQYSLTFLNA